MYYKYLVYVYTMQLSINKKTTTMRTVIAIIEHQHTEQFIEDVGECIGFGEMSPIVKEVEGNFRTVFTLEVKTEQHEHWIILMEDQFENA